MTPQQRKTIQQYIDDRAELLTLNTREAAKKHKIRFSTAERLMRCTDLAPDELPPKVTPAIAEDIWAIKARRELLLSRSKRKDVQLKLGMGRERLSACIRELRAEQGITRDAHCPVQRQEDMRNLFLMRPIVSDRQTATS